MLQKVGRVKILAASLGTCHWAGLPFSMAVRDALSQRCVMRAIVARYTTLCSLKLRRLDPQFTRQLSACCHRDGLLQRAGRAFPSPLLDLGPVTSRYRYQQQTCRRLYATFSQDETIYALSTPPGTSAIAVVRISGPACCEVAHQRTEALGATQLTI